MIMTGSDLGSQAHVQVPMLNEKVQNIESTKCRKEIDGPIERITITPRELEDKYQKRVDSSEVDIHQTKVTVKNESAPPGLNFRNSL